MRCYNLDGCAVVDAEDARRVASHLEIPFHVFDFEEEYKERVVSYMVEGYRKGVTPNPDVMCNKEIKFGLFLEKALGMGADYIATGHYTCLKEKDGVFSLWSAEDEEKDQGYFLWTLEQEQLKRCLFPIGDYKKSEVRELAREAELPTAEKKDSQGICFLGKVSLADFLKERIPEKRGSVLSIEGEKVGEHDGAYFYTVGQRHLDIGSRPTGSGGEHKPYYVTSRDVENNTITVAEGSDSPNLYTKEVNLREMNFMGSEFGGGKVMARIRYRQPLFAAELVKGGDDYGLIFSEGQKAVAAGQSAVFYSSEGELLGGGVIIRT